MVGKRSDVALAFAKRPRLELTEGRAGEGVLQIETLLVPPLSFGDDRADREDQYQLGDRNRDR